MKALRSAFGIRDEETIRRDLETKQKELEDERKELETRREEHSTADDKLTADILESYSKLPISHADHRDAHHKDTNREDGGHEVLNCGEERHESALKELHENRKQVVIQIHEHQKRLDDVHARQLQNEQQRQGFHVRTRSEHERREEMEKTHKQSGMAHTDRARARHDKIQTAQKQHNASHSRALTMMSGGVVPGQDLKPLKEEHALTDVIVKKGKTPGAHKDQSKNLPVRGGSKGAGQGTTDGEREIAMRKAQSTAMMHF